MINWFRYDPERGGKRRAQAEMTDPFRRDFLKKSNGTVTGRIFGLTAVDGATAANVQWLPQGVVVTGSANSATRDNVILADINAVTHTCGVAEPWINCNGGRPNDGPNVWPSFSFAEVSCSLQQGVIATGVGTSGVDVQFADLNSDGRAEYLDVNYLTSAVNARLNGFSPKSFKLQAQHLRHCLEQTQLPCPRICLIHRLILKVISPNIRMKEWES
ncbi:hypothetical protein K438DRAFT_1762431 [Mycena galopus ATCC 62051]|nr:hypothetical protein K438DRAFT_1762431 [Mycena galopus ATCC 62051]